MRNLARPSHKFSNYFCTGFRCNSHYYGDKGKEKWYNTKDWEDYVNIIDGVDWRKKYMVCPK